MRKVTERLPEIIKKADLESGLNKAVLAERLDIIPVTFSASKRA